MFESIEAHVGSRGGNYADGTPNLEIYFSPDDARETTLLNPTETAITLVIAEREYQGTVLANAPEHDRAWISPTIYYAGTRLRLGEVLTEAGFSTGAITLDVDGNRVRVRA